MGRAWRPWIASIPALVVALLACEPSAGSPGSPPPPTPPAIPTASTDPGRTPSLDPPPTGSPVSGAVAVDDDLLDHLPATVAGAPLVADPDAAARVASDPSLGESAIAIAVALVVVSTDDAEDLAISSVVRLRPGVYSDAFFADWRASYDEAACAPAGGATGEVARTIAGLEAFAGSCAGGAMTYHVHRPDDGILVSITSVGSQDLGALVVAGLR